MVPARVAAACVDARSPAAPSLLTVDRRWCGVWRELRAGGWCVARTARRWVVCGANCAPVVWCVARTARRWAVCVTWRERRARSSRGSSFTSASRRPRPRRLPLARPPARAAPRRRPTTARRERARHTRRLRLSSMRRVLSDPGEAILTYMYIFIYISLSLYGTRPLSTPPAKVRLRTARARRARRARRRRARRRDARRGARRASSRRRTRGAHADGKRTEAEREGCTLSFCPGKRTEARDISPRRDENESLAWSIARRARETTTVPIRLVTRVTREVVP